MEVVPTSPSDLISGSGSASAVTAKATMTDWKRILEESVQVLIGPVVYRGKEITPNIEVLEQIL
jgi:hypothetical protein